MTEEIEIKLTESELNVLARILDMVAENFFEDLKEADIFNEAKSIDKKVIFAINNK